MSRGAVSRSDPTTCCEIFMVYLKDSLPGIAVCKLCEMSDDFTGFEVRFGYPTHLRQHLDEQRASRGRERT